MTKDWLAVNSEREIGERMSMWQTIGQFGLTETLRNTGNGICCCEAVQSRYVKGGLLAVTVGGVLVGYTGLCVPRV